MGRQKKNLHPKGMEDFPLKELNEMEVSKLSDIEFKIIVIRMLKELTDNYKKLSCGLSLKMFHVEEVGLYEKLADAAVREFSGSENYNSMKKEIETINKSQEEMKNRISEIKNTLEGITNRLHEAEDQISELDRQGGN